MSASDQYRARAAEFAELARTASIPEESREHRKLEQSFTSLAINEEWLAGNFDKTLHAPQLDQNGDPAALPPDEEQILRYLGAAVIMQWSTIPKKLQRELFDSAGAMGEMLDTTTLRGQIARFLHNHKDDVR
ncbi:MAG: hypothetical protein ABSG76_13015 [Xanthobacteraceae bacterium]|jgi:hypothetical protein